MKKIIIASFVGAIIFFFWQFASYAALDLHKSAQGYTEKEQAILSFIESQGLEEGGYVLPNVPPGTSSAGMEEYMAKAEGKPWATLQYHKAMDTGMAMNMVRGFISDFAIIYLFCWIILKIPGLTFRTTVLSALALGMIVFLNSYYINYIWFKNFDIKASLLDCIISWGLAGLWLGYYLTKTKRITSEGKPEVKRYEMAS